MIEVTLDSFFKLEMMFESNIDFSGFQRSHFGRRTLQKLNILIGSPILDQTASARIDLVVSLKFYLPSILCRGQGMQKGVISWLQVSNLLMYYFITDHRKTY